MLCKPIVALGHHETTDDVFMIFRQEDGKLGVSTPVVNAKFTGARDDNGKVVNVRTRNGPTYLAAMSDEAARGLLLAFWAKRDKQNPAPNQNVA